jgi:uncharacterized protein (DUF1501 family)
MPPTDPAETRFTRRRFLVGTGVLTSAVVGGHVLQVFGRTAAAGAAGPAPRLAGTKGRTVLFVELAGGNDGLSTVVPYTDPAYRSLRPTLAVGTPLDLDGVVGLHPSLPKLAARYRAGQVAVVEGVGYPDNDLSHFASLANWWTAQPGAPGTTGWLGRYLDATVGFDDPLAGVVIGSGPSPALVGERSFATSISDASGLEPRAPAWLGAVDPLLDDWARFGNRRADRHDLEGRIRRAIALTDDARAELGAALDRDGASDAELDARAYNGGGTALEAFDVAARLVVAKQRPRVVYVTNLGDYDTHQGQGQRHPALLADLDAGLDHFLTTVEAAGVADRVVVMTLSEFGRRVQENGSGTDHGNAAPHFIIGTKVKGGRYGRPASLADLDARGNLPFGVDFRRLYATALEGWLGVDAEPILGRGFSPEPIFG